MKQLPGLVPASATIAAAFGGLWLGEHSDAVTTLLHVGALLVLAGLATWALWGTSRVAAIGGGVAVAAVFVVCFAAGMREAQLALGECVDDADRVRDLLADYREAHGAYPERLGDLGVFLPGQLLLPPHTLRYRRTAGGYVLWFEDWLATHEATDQRGFEVHK